MLVLLALASSADARDVIREAPPTLSPEAWYVLDTHGSGTPPQIRCSAEAVVAPDGRVEHARAVGCPAVLHEAVVAAVNRWRWERASGPTVEQARVSVRAPSLRPRDRRKACLVGVVVHDGQPKWIATPTARCELGLAPVAPTAPPRQPGRIAWCAVDLTVEDGTIRSMSADACAEGYATSALEAVRTWSIPTDRDRRWRLLVAWEKAPPISVDFG